MPFGDSKALGTSDSGRPSSGGYCLGIANTSGFETCHRVEATSGVAGRKMGTYEFDTQFQAGSIHSNLAKDT